MDFDRPLYWIIHITVIKVVNPLPLFVERNGSYTYWEDDREDALIITSD